MLKSFIFVPFWCIVSASHFHLIKWPRPWEQARVFCQTYYVDLAVLSTEEQYLRLQDAIPTQKDFWLLFWLGLKRDDQHSDWKWVSNEELSYDRWYHINKGVRCGSLKAAVSKDRRLLGRYCKEHHSSVCQGPVGPQKALLESLGCDHLTATWNVSASMRDVDHAYNITMCGATCDTFLYVYYTGINHTSVSINLSNLTCSSNYVMNITATVTRLDAATGKNTTLQSSTMTMSMTTAPSGVHPGTHTWLILAIFAFVALTVALLLFNFCHRPHTCSGQ